MKKSYLLLMFTFIFWKSDVLGERIKICGVPKKVLNTYENQYYGTKNGLAVLPGLPKDGKLNWVAQRLNSQFLKNLNTMQDKNEELVCGEVTHRSENPLQNSIMNDVNKINFVPFDSKKENEKDFINNGYIFVVENEDKKDLSILANQNDEVCGLPGRKFTDETNQKYSTKNGFLIQSIPDKNNQPINPSGTNAVCGKLVGFWNDSSKDNDVIEKDAFYQSFNPKIHNIDDIKYSGDWLVIDQNNPDKYKKSAK
jgi:hypothetical protein